MKGKMLCGLWLAAGAAWTQTPESLTAWRYYQELTNVAETGLAMVELPMEALSGSRTDHADIRLYDAEGREVPYALRVRREIHESADFEAREINRGERGDVAEATFDLGADPATHNQLEIETVGDGFRRIATVEGSRNGEEWLTLAEKAPLFRFAARGREVDQQRVDYDESDYRYLRVRVEADRQVEFKAPTITKVTVRKVTRSPAVDKELAVGPGVREAGRDQERPASIYPIELYGRIPLHGLNIQAGEAPFSRPYRLEIETQENERTLLASGTLRSDPEAPADPVKLRFPEQFAERLILTVVDDRNPPLGMYGGTALSAARQVVFSGQGFTQPLRLYYGNPDAPAPNYDFDSTVPLTPPEDVSLVYPNGQQENPDYEPPQAPLTERAPWAIYVVLAVASIAILGLLRKVVATVGQTS
jgi:hypothetical protein